MLIAMPTPSLRDAGLLALPPDRGRPGAPPFLNRAPLARLGALLLVLATLTARPSHAQFAPNPAQPEAATGQTEKTLVRTRRTMVVAAHPLASAAGLEILDAGGSAVDAAIAVQAVLGLVEPQSSGLGGGAFLLTWDARSRRVQSYDGRETAPASARPDRFLVDGKPLGFAAAAFSGLSVGVPGVVAVLELAHKTHGTLAWARLFEPAIRLADQGFTVTPRLAGLLAADRRERFSPIARAYFFGPDSRPIAAGSRLANPAYATTLRRIAEGGGEAFYRGPIAEQIVEAVRGAPGRVGDMTTADLAGYRAVERVPLCRPYRRHEVCGMGPPSSGGIAVLQSLGLIEPLLVGWSPRAALGPAGVHLVGEALKLAFADRDRYVADADHVPVPGGLLDQGYLAERRALIVPDRASLKVTAGTPPLHRGAYTSPGEDATIEGVGTSHISIVDQNGNAVAMTTSIETAFGSGLMAGGMLLNNQLTDFSFRPFDQAGMPVANRVEALKRPRSSMAPTIVLGPDGRPRYVIGSPGGARIIPYVVKTLIALIDGKLDPQRAAALPNFSTRGGSLELELGSGWSFSPSRLVAATETLARVIWLKGLGHRVALGDMTSGLHVIAIEADGLHGGADPRREGVVRGR